MSVSKRDTERAWADPEDAPELTGGEIERGVWRVGGKRVSLSKGKAAFRTQLGKQKVNMLLDNVVVSHFRRRAAGRGYQTLINQALRDTIEREKLETVLRRIVREELHRR